MNTEQHLPLTAEESAELDRLRAKYDPDYAPAVKLTPAARKYLVALQAGQPVRLTYGPYTQLLNAGLITGPQNAPVLM